MSQLRNTVSSVFLCLLLLEACDGPVFVSSGTCICAVLESCAVLLLNNIKRVKEGLKHSFCENQPQENVGGMAS